MSTDIIEESFVNYDVAKHLEFRKFRDKVIWCYYGYYNDIGNDECRNYKVWNLEKDKLSAPTIDEACAWILEYYGYHISTHYNHDEKQFTWTIQKTNIDGNKQNCWTYENDGKKDKPFEAEPFRDHIFTINHAIEYAFDSIGLFTKIFNRSESKTLDTTVSKSIAIKLKNAGYNFSDMYFYKNDDDGLPFHDGRFKLYKNWNDEKYKDLITAPFHHVLAKVILKYYNYHITTSFNDGGFGWIIQNINVENDCYLSGIDDEKPKYDKVEDAMNTGFEYFLDNLLKEERLDKAEVYDKSRNPKSILYV